MSKVTGDNSIVYVQLAMEFFKNILSFKKINSKRKLQNMLLKIQKPIHDSRRYHLYWYIV